MSACAVSGGKGLIEIKARTVCEATGGTNEVRRPERPVALLGVRTCGSNRRNSASSRLAFHLHAFSLFFWSHSDTRHYASTRSDAVLCAKIHGSIARLRIISKRYYDRMHVPPEITPSTDSVVPFQRAQVLRREHAASWFTMRQSSAKFSGLAPCFQLQLQTSDFLADTDVRCFET